MKLTPDPRTNRIFITGPPDSLSLVQRLIESFDESPAASAQIKVFQITNGDASDLVQVLRSLFPEQAATSNVPQLATAEGETSLVPVRFSVDIRTNSIITTGTSGDLKIIEALLLRLDETDSQERVNEVYRLKNSPAMDVANAVNNFLRSERIVNQAAPGRQNPFTQIESEVVVVPEPVGNALIISATPRYFEQILDLVEDLDAQPPQVMIQVILAEVALDNLHEFGVELGLQDSLLFDRSLLGDLLTPGYNFNNQPLGNANNPSSLAARGNVAGQGLTHFSLGRTSADTGYGGLVLSASNENVSVLLRALNQSRTVEILSRPQIMTLDNQPAFIQVGQRVPQIRGSTVNNCWTKQHYRTGECGSYSGGHTTHQSGRNGRHGSRCREIRSRIRGIQRHSRFHLRNWRGGSGSQNQYRHSPDDSQCCKWSDNRHRRADHRQQEFD